MERRALGSSGLHISVIGLGTMTFGGTDEKFGAIGQTDVREAERLIDIAIEQGVNFFDTSDNYARGQSEIVLGKALGNKRKNIILGTKVFGRTGSGADDIGLSRAHIISACEASLHRLGTDYIDLYQVHNHDSLVPMEETLRALDDLVRAGKVRHIGCSNHFAWQMVKARGLSALQQLAPYVSQQILYSLLYRHAEYELLPAAQNHNMGSLIYSPLAQGYLTGKFSLSQSHGRLVATHQLAGVDTEQARAIVHCLQNIANNGPENRNAGHIALRWLIDRPAITTVIIGARNAEQLIDNLKAAHMEISAEETMQLDEVSAQKPWYPRTAQRIFHPERNPTLF